MEATHCESVEGENYRLQDIQLPALFFDIVWDDRRSRAAYGRD
jgi:hypothetical protein